MWGIAKTTRRIAVIAILVLVAWIAIGVGEPVKNPDTLVEIATLGISTLDPQWQWDASAHVVCKIYDKLYQWADGSVAEYEPVLSTVVPTVENGLVTTAPDGTTYYSFPIRPGVYFHQVGVRQNDGSIEWLDFDSLSLEERRRIVPGYGELTPEDVKYSYMRYLIQDRSGGGVSNLIEPISGGYGSIEAMATDIAGVEAFDEVDEASLLAAFDTLDGIITVGESNVQFALPKPYAPFLSGHARQWLGQIVDKEWVVAQGGWPGTGETWADYHDPAAEESVLFEMANGTGPFKLVSWDRTNKIVTLERFDGYWRGPAGVRSYVRQVVDDPATRRLMLESGDADIVAGVVLVEGEVPEGITWLRGLPALSMTNIFFQYSIGGDDNSAIGSGQLDGNGIPRDFFSDIDVRKAFAYAFDYDVFHEQVLLGEGTKPKGPILAEHIGYSEEQPEYTFDLAKAEEHFRQAWGGAVWEMGFRFSAFTSEAFGQPAKSTLDILREGLLAINPQFVMEIESVQWGTYLANLFGTHSMPLYYLGLGFSADPHVSVLGLMSAKGLMGTHQGENYTSLCAEVFDPLIEEGVQTLDVTGREAIYDQLQRLSYEYAINIWLNQNSGALVTRDWVQGLYWNPEDTYVNNYWAVWKGY